MTERDWLETDLRVLNATPEDARRDYTRLHSALADGLRNHLVLWKETRIHDETNRVVEVCSPQTSALSVFFHIHGHDGVLLTVWAETAIGKIPVVSSRLDDRYGRRMMGYRVVEAAARRYVFEVRPARGGTAPVLTLGIEPR